MNSAKAFTSLGSPMALSAAEFKMFRDLIFEKSGINLHEGKKELLRTRLGSRIRAKELRSFKDYYDLINKDKTDVELMGLLDAISTNLTSFFREVNHFHFLEKTIIPEIVTKGRQSNNKELRCWSAGCSSGEEPYTIILSLLNNPEISETWKIKMLATDISVEMLEKAFRAVYAEEKINTVPKEMVRKYFVKGTNDKEGLYRVRQEISKLVQFKRFNLMTKSFPFSHKFNFIFCRNVMIYFDKPTQEVLISKFYNALARGGYLLIGHSESLTGIEHQFKYVLPTIYKKSV
jgi:chemotaxis protein methyltransferase CheR